ncbi:MAG TPA: PASTA domain-containing protein [Pyrinomonadaceae bacterium]|nr:PASTA domain-containing protein [Pyrinomonadaceae bacterium]
MIAIVVVFLFGVATTVYLSLRSPETKVPNVVGKDRFEAEKILEEADLKFRVRAYRPSNQANPDTVLFQLPRAGEVVKAGQTVAMDISRPTKAGETPETVPTPEDTNANRNTNAPANANANRPRRPANRNENANGNTNVNANRPANANANANRPANVNRPAANANITPRSNVNRSDQRNTNSRTNSNLNENRRPVAPRPTPGVPNPNRQNP